MPAISKIVRLVYLYPLQTSPEFLNLWSLCNLVELFRHDELMFGFYQYGSRHVFLFKYFIRHNSKRRQTSHVRYCSPAIVLFFFIRLLPAILCFHVPSLPPCCCARNLVTFMFPFFFLLLLLSASLLVFLS